MTMVPSRRHNLSNNKSSKQQHPGGVFYATPITATTPTTLFAGDIDACLSNNQHLMINDSNCFVLTSELRGLGIRTCLTMGDNEEHASSTTSKNNNSSINNNNNNNDNNDSLMSSTTKTPDEDPSSSSSWLQLGLPLNSDTRQSSLMLDLNLGGSATSTSQLPPPPPPRPHDSYCLFGGSTINSTTNNNNDTNDSFPCFSPPIPPFSNNYQINHHNPEMSTWGFLFNHHLNYQEGTTPLMTTSTINPFLLPSNNTSGSSSHFKLIHPPPIRSHTGIWFTLLPSLHQSTQPFLPQLSKSFIRIKDGRMRVDLVMKYVANKLGLDTHSQVEIRCRGQVLGAYLTLQHVRDQIWCPSQAFTLLQDSATSQHLMLLHYATRTTVSTYP